MSQRRRKGPREKDLTGRFLSGDFDEDRVDQQQRFSARSKGAQQSKILRTAELRAAEQDTTELDALPQGQVVQVYSLYCEVEHAGRMYLCVVRKTLTKVSGAPVIVGDFVRFRETGATDESGRPEAVIEAVLPRRTILTRTDSFRGLEQHPIVANAEQMLIVASIRQPRVKWGLVDRMLIAAQGGGLESIVCLNKIDLVEPAGPGAADVAEDSAQAQRALAHYRALGARTLETSVAQRRGLDELAGMLRDRITVLAGHSGVGKSSLIRAVQPSLDLRIGHVSEITEKGRHTTTSARRYPLEMGGQVIDTPGVKLFGLWGVTADNLDEFFPDVAGGTAPSWRQHSYERIARSLSNAEG